MKTKFSFLLFLFIFLSFSAAIAGEVDAFRPINDTIKDSSSAINIYINNKVQSILESFKSKSCESASLFVMQELGSTNYGFIRIGALNTDMETWIELNTMIDKVPHGKQGRAIYNRHSIYAPNLKIFRLWRKDLDPTINVDGIYIGTDKISHFLGSGYEYYGHYLRKKKYGFSEYEARLDAIRQGFVLEKTIIGIWPVGIFSYGDLEANYQGFRLAHDLCDKAMLHRIGRRWALVKKINIQKYVNPNWDEAYNPNSYTQEREKNVKKNLVKFQRCEQIVWEKYDTRIAEYEHRIRGKEELFLPYTSLSSFVVAICSEKSVGSQKNMYIDLTLKTGLQWPFEQFEKYCNALHGLRESFRLKAYCQKP